MEKQSVAEVLPYRRRSPLTILGAGPVMPDAQHTWLFLPPPHPVYRNLGLLPTLAPILQSGKCPLGAAWGAKSNEIWSLWLWVKGAFGKMSR